jgi:hypothetical protein
MTDYDTGTNGVPQGCSTCEGTRVAHDKFGVVDCPDCVPAGVPVGDDTHTTTDGQWTVAGPA